MKRGFVEVGNSSAKGDGEGRAKELSPEPGRRGPGPPEGGSGAGPKLLDAPMGHRIGCGVGIEDRVEALKEAWFEFLGRIKWEWFATFTFRDLIHPEAADKRFRVFISKANRQLYGPRWGKKRLGIKWVRALEFQRRGVLHYHALMSGVGDLRRLTYMDEWNRLAGFAKIEPVRDDEAVRGYVSKYVVKGGEIDVGGNWLDPPEILTLPLVAPTIDQDRGSRSD